MISLPIFPKLYAIDLLKKALKKAKEDAYFEREIYVTKTIASANITLATKSNNTSTWKDYTATAPASGWYHVYCNPGSATYPACYITENYGTRCRNALSNDDRDFTAGPIYVVKGETISYGCVSTDYLYLRYSPAYEYH